MMRMWTMFLSGVVVGAVVAVAGMTGGSVLSAAVSGVQTPVKGVQTPVKYESKVVLENDLVRVKDVTFPAGVLDTGMHTHDLAHVGVIISEGSLMFTDEAGKKEIVEFLPGMVGFREADATHMVANPGKQAMRVIEVEIKKKGGAKE